MKKFAVLIYIIAVILVGCSAGTPKHESVNDFSDITVIDSDLGEVPHFTATVIEVREGAVLVEPDEGTSERRSADRITVSTDTANRGMICHVKAGERVAVYYRGGIMETYPAALSETVAIFKIDENGNTLPN